LISTYAKPGAVSSLCREFSLFYSTPSEPNRSNSWLCSSSIAGVITSEDWNQLGYLTTIFFFRTPPPQKRQKQSLYTTSPNTANREVPIGQAPLAPRPNADHPQSQSATSPNPRKRRASNSPKLNTLPPGTTLPGETVGNVSISSLLTDDANKKRGRTNTPWTPQEEQRLKQMRDAGHSWSEIAKVVFYCSKFTISGL
jgi:hypothetical protein